MKKIIVILTVMAVILLTAWCSMTPGGSLPEHSRDNGDSTHESTNNNRDNGNNAHESNREGTHNDRDESAVSRDHEPGAAVLASIAVMDPDSFPQRIKARLGFDRTATDIVSDIRMGWVLGNTLDAHGNRQGFPNLGGGVYANTSVQELETGWGRPVTTPQHFAAIRDAGFNAIRIPVTWYKACDPELNIREDWMARVKEVVDYAVELDFYIVLNTHHDDVLFGLGDDVAEESAAAIAKIWSQIATAFKDYDERLVFESLNEPRTIGSDNEWRGGTPEEHNNLNMLNQVFVDTVRSSGGNNARRVLLVPTYAAAANETAQRAFVMPQDSVSDKLIVSLHYYEPWNFALRTGDGSVATWSVDNPDDTGAITWALDLAYEIFIANNIPVIMGEMGAINRDNLEARVAWAEFYVSYARSKKIPCFWWDNGSYWVVRRQSWGWEQTFGLLDRVNIEIAHPEIVAALMRATE